MSYLYCNIFSSENKFSNFLNIMYKVKNYFPQILADFNRLLPIIFSVNYPNYTNYVITKNYF
jgi:hypothetical protein